MAAPKWSALEHKKSSNDVHQARSCTSSNTVASASAISPETLATCKDMQEDELLALEAIYEQRFSYTRDDHGRLVFHVTVEADLQEERDVLVIEEPIVAFEPSWHKHPATSDQLPVPERQRGRGRGRGRGGRSGKSGSRNDPPQPSKLSPGHPVALNGVSDKSLDLRDLHNALPIPTVDIPKPQEHHLKLQYLLPITFTLVLTEAYPLEHPPHLSLESPWLLSSLKQSLLSRLSSLWQHDVSTFIMVDDLVAALQDVSILGNPVLLRDRYFYEPNKPAPQRNTLHSRLQTHDRLTRHSTFSSESFDCGICLETKKGARCAKVRSCGHVFCVECLHSFFELNIREGLVKNVCCADMQCVKQRGKGDEKRGSVELDEIEAIVGKDLLDRYTWLVEKQKVESDPTITYCPRDGCNAPVPKEKDDDYERLRICPKCGYSFCVYCRRTYHGTKSRCVFSQAASIVDKYINGDGSVKAGLETRYGKTNVQKMVEMWLEEQANAKWIKDNSTPCPDCQLDIERSMGCAHMTCGRCNCHFCFRCGSRLNAKDPYSHFSTPGWPCYNKLFDIQPSGEQQWEEALMEQLVEFD